MEIKTILAGTFEYSGCCIVKVNEAIYLSPQFQYTVGLMFQILEASFK